jgi:hypothetical protein
MESSGVLYMVYFVGPMLIAQGVAKRFVHGMWAAAVITPAIVVSISVTWGGLFLALLVPALLAVFWRPEHA